MKIETTATIHAPADIVWRILADVERWPEWTPTVIRVEPQGAAELASGSRFRIVQPKLRPAVWTVTELDPERGFTWVSGGAGLRVVAEHRLDPGPGSTPDSPATRVTLRLAFEGLFSPVVGRMARRLSEQYVAQECAGLKRRAEAFAAAARQP